MLEAGRADFLFDPLIHMPAALMFPSGNPLYDWAYETEPEPHMGGRRVPHARGKVLGGSSSINGMVYVRGHPRDFDTWAEMGADGWSFAVFDTAVRWTRTGWPRDTTRAICSASGTLTATAGIGVTPSAHICTPVWAMR